MTRQHKGRGEKAPGVREMMDHIHEQNQRDAERRKRLAGSPEVGIFWDVNGRLIIAGAFLEEAQTWGRFAHYPMEHEQAWPSYQRVEAAPLDMEYDDAPRGRVVYDKVTQQFHLYADACILLNEAMLGKIRSNLSLPSEIEMGPDNFYQCVTCLGFSASDVGCVPRARKPGFAFNRESYMDQLREVTQTALWRFFNARVDPRGDPQDADPLQENEVRRLIDLQLPSLISIAATNGRFSRTRAIEEAIGEAEQKATEIWQRVVHGTAKRRDDDPSARQSPDRRQLETTFFSWVRTNCTAAAKVRKIGRMRASPGQVLDVWSHVAAALSYHFELEIARSNNHLTRVVWFEDRVHTFLHRLGDLIERRNKTKLDVAAIKAGVDLAPVDRVWNFALKEIAHQLGKLPGELLLPDRNAIEATFFARVDKIIGSAE
jgi:hypothetical protein